MRVFHESFVTEQRNTVSKRKEAWEQQREATDRQCQDFAKRLTGIRTHICYLEGEMNILSQHVDSYAAQQVAQNAEHQLFEKRAKAMFESYEQALQTRHQSSMPRLPTITTPSTCAESAAAEDHFGVRSSPCHQKVYSVQESTSCPSFADVPLAMGGQETSTGVQAAEPSPALTLPQKIHKLQSVQTMAQRVKLAAVRLA